jgi:hypothetical protein
VSRFSQTIAERREILQRIAEALGAGSTMSVTGPLPLVCATLGGRVEARVVELEQLLKTTDGERDFAEALTLRLTKTREAALLIAKAAALLDPNGDEPAKPEPES